ncbi:MAG: hypothetical protein Q7R93_02515 [bacterium]|nr:hypothetical protein [bacterium]
MIPKLFVAAAILVLGLAYIDLAMHPVSYDVQVINKTPYPMFFLHGSEVVGEVVPAFSTQTRVLNGYGTGGTFAVRFENAAAGNVSGFRYIRPQRDKTYQLVVTLEGVPTIQ